MSSSLLYTVSGHICIFQDNSRVKMTKDLGIVYTDPALGLYKILDFVGKRSLVIRTGFTTKKEIEDFVAVPRPEQIDRCGLMQEIADSDASSVGFRGILPDSGKRREFPTGSVRDLRDGKGRFDLVTPIGLRRLAQHYENGAKKYGDRNWEKGQPITSYCDSAIRHMYAYLAGDRSEDHLAAVAWNALAAIHTGEKVMAGELPAELNDVPGGVV